MKEVHDFLHIKVFQSVAFLTYVPVNKGTQEIRDAATGSGWHFSGVSLHSHHCSNMLQDKGFQRLKYFEDTLLKM